MEEYPLLQAQPLTLADAILSRPRASYRSIWLVQDIALMLGFAAFVALSAQVAMRLPWTTVPITGQTFAVLVAGGALGVKRGAGSMSIYMLAGMVGVPVFAPANPGISGDWGAHVILPWRGSGALPWDISSGGYIVGFIAAAAVVGFLAERAWDRKPWVHLAMLLGSVIIYVPGVLWLAYLIGSDWTPAGATKPLADLIAGSGTWDKALKGGLYPFVVGDLMKLLLAALVLPSAWAALDRLRPRSNGQG